MSRLKDRSLTVAALCIGAAECIGAQMLYEQAVTRILHARFRSENLSYLLLDAASGRVVDARWPEVERAVAPGSLVKPFAALAWRESHERYPVLVCRGKRDGCWYAAGHGRMGIVEAIANSCNAYFVALAREVRWEDAAAVARRLGIATPPAGSPESLAGMGDRWRIAPADLARAYCALSREGAASELLEGMALSAVRGTGRGAGAGWVKTGTAPCGHARRAPGDGYAVVLDHRFGILVRVHGVTGAQAAELAGRMMRAVREGR